MPQVYHLKLKDGDNLYLDREVFAAWLAKNKQTAGANFRTRLDQINACLVSLRQIRFSNSAVDWTLEDD